MPVVVLILIILLVLIYAGGLGWLAGKVFIALHILAACALPSVVVLAVVVALLIITIVALA